MKHTALKEKSVMNKRVLVISHNSFSNETNMGKTLESQFSSYDNQCIAQLFFSNEIPVSNCCKNFFRITDIEVIKSILTRRKTGSRLKGKMFIKNDINDKWISHKVRKKGRIPFIYIARNLIWILGRWKSIDLFEWLNEFNPEVIYYASGDYSFSYKITKFISKKLEIPIIIGCYDDFYINKYKTINPMYYLNRYTYLREVRSLFALSSCFTAVSDKMNEDYSALFHRKGFTLYTPTVNEKKYIYIKSNKIVYAGNLGQGRADQLIRLGRIISHLNIEGISKIHVYSAEQREEITNKLKEESSISFHGRITSDEVWNILCESKYIIHTESFEDEHKNRVKYSFSTKIADSLGSGSCLIAIGPEDVASIEYLIKNRCACVLTQWDNASKKLTELFSNAEMYNYYVKNAGETVKRNHNLNKIQEVLSEVINYACENGRRK